jgi:hypothetical protein
MKSISKTFLVPVIGLALFAGIARASDRSQLFSLVPQGDSAYTSLSVLESDGLLSPGDSKGPLTRFEMAERIFKAETQYKVIVVAQNDMDLPPPPPDAGGTPLPPGDNAAPAVGGSELSSSAGSSAPIWKDPKKVEEAEKNLKTLQEAYDFELKLVKDQKEDLNSKLSKAESDQFDLWKSVKGITEYPSVSIHGVGRAFAWGDQYFGNTSFFPNSFRNPNSNNLNTSNAFREGFAFLDLEPTGSVSKELRWMASLRLATDLLPVTQPSAPTLEGFGIRRVSAEFNPDFMSVSLGDFYESYSPLTLWSRDSLDIFYKPEPVARWERDHKYDSFLNQQPDWSFRGLRMGTSLGWPDSNILQSVSASGFIHMLRQGFSDTGGGWYLGPNLFTDLLVAGKGEVKSKKWYVGGTSWQLTADTYGVLLDEPLDSTLPGSPYQQFDTSTWAHQYLIGSVAPNLRIGVGDDIYFGLQYEGAFSSYQDDKNNSNSSISDFALNMGPFLQFGDSKITFTYMNNGPNFYSPFAQVRDDVAGITFIGPAMDTYNFANPQLLNPYVTNQFPLGNVPRASAIFGFYDRTRDNTLPYGLASPNREGIGGTLDIETLDKKSLKIKAAAYFLNEISGNLVVNSAGTGYTGLDTTPGGAIPKRSFTYINIGPSFDIGPSAGLSTPLEIGTNIRFEETTSAAGTLDSFWILGGVRAGLVPGWEVSGAFGARSFSGSDMGYNGLPIARYSYLFNNSDLGFYAPFTVNGYDDQYILSTTIETGKNTKLHLDYSLDWGNQVQYYGGIPGVLNNQFVELSYETIF